MDSDQNLSAVLHGINDLRMEISPTPEVGKNDVLVRMAKVGICGTDVSFMTKGKVGHFEVQKPMILGHEGSGTVVKCGSAVQHLKEGDRVAIEPAVPCRLCSFCKGGRYNLCRDIKCCSTPPDHGNLCRFYKHPADFCYKLPDHVTLEEGALLEPLSVAVHACRRAKVGVGSRVLICGAGPIGLVCLMTAKAMGASVTCVTDLIDSRLKLAKKIGADYILNVSGKFSEEISKEISDILNGELPDITLECSGAEMCLNLGIIATKSGGTMAMVGLSSSTEVKIPIVESLLREVDIRGIMRYVNCYPPAINLMSSRQVDLKPIITHRFKLEDSVKAFELASSGKDGAVKIVISC